MLKLTPATPSPDATVTSLTYTVSSVSTTSGGTGTITNIPYGTSKAAFESNLTKDQGGQTWNDSGIHDPVISGDTLVVTAQDGSTTATYTITVNAQLSLSAIGSTTGTPQVGVSLTAGSLTPSGATASYQWTESATSGSGYTDISGATSSTYTPVTGDVNYYIEVVATGTGGYTGSVTSTPVGPVVAATGFSYYRSITIDHTKVGTVSNTDQSSFPVEVSLSDATLSHASGHVTNANGYDIELFSDPGLTTRLPAERETYTDSSGVGTYIGWVNVPTVSHTTNTVIYMAYGNSGISTDPNSDATYGATHVWDSNYKGVWHLNAASGGTENDSTSNGNNSTSNSSTATTGEIGGGAAFVGASSQYINIGSTASLNGLTTLTASGWVQVTPGNSGAISGSWSGGGNYNWLLYFDGTKTHLVWSNNGNYNNGGNIAGGTSLSGGTWYYITAKISGTTATIYVNGVQDATGGSVALAGSGIQQIGATNGSNYINGKIDESRISNSARSADWIKTEYNNQSNPGNIGSPGFYTVGGGRQQQEVPLPLPPSVQPPVRPKSVLH
jgi:hypothetical protein